MDSSVMKPSIKQTTVVLENIAALQKHQYYNQSTLSPASFSLQKSYSELALKLWNIPLNFEVPRLLIEPSQFPLNSGFPMKLKREEKGINVKRSPIFLLGKQKSRHHLYEAQLATYLSGGNLEKFLPTGIAPTKLL